MLGFPWPHTRLHTLPYLAAHFAVPQVQLARADRFLDVRPFEQELRFIIAASHHLGLELGVPRPELFRQDEARVRRVPCRSLAPAIASAPAFRRRRAMCSRGSRPLGDMRPHEHRPSSWSEHPEEPVRKSHARAAPRRQCRGRRRHTGAARARSVRALNVAPSAVSYSYTPPPTLS